MGKIAVAFVLCLAASGCGLPEGFEASPQMVRWDKDTQFRIEELPDGFQVYVVHGYTFSGNSKRKLEEAGKAVLWEIVRQELNERKRAVQPFSPEDIRTVDRDPSFCGKLRIYWND